MQLFQNPLFEGAAVLQPSIRHSLTLVEINTTLFSNDCYHGKCLQNTSVWYQFSFHSIT